MQKRINLNVVTSALHPNTLAAPAGELVGQTGAQLQLDRAHICHKYHKLYLWRKNCHVEKFLEILGNFGKFWRNFKEILGNFA